MNVPVIVAMTASELINDYQTGEIVNVHLVVAAALLDDGGRVLVQQRRTGRNHGGLWEFPGGKVEQGETLIAALVRELAEELAINVDPDTPFPIGFTEVIQDGGRLLLMLYRVDAWAGAVQCLDAQALAWVAPSALGTFDMPPADIALIAAIQRSFVAPA